MKNISVFTNVFPLSPETFSPAFVLRSLLSTFSMSLPVLSLFCQTFWRMIIVVKTKRQLRSKSIVSLACLVRALFAVELIFSTYGYRNEKQITPRRAEMTSFKPRVHEESEVESYLTQKFILRACLQFRKEVEKWLFD